MARENYYCPTWEFTKEASLRLIERGQYGVMKLPNERCFFIPDYQNPFRAKDSWNNMYFLLPLDSDFETVFWHTKQIPVRPGYIKKFHHRVFVDLLAASADEDLYKGYFYILECDGFYKIGIAQDFQNRKWKYITENPHPIHEVFADRVYCADKIELALKKLFKHQRHRGEWYNFSTRDIVFITGALSNIIYV